MLAAILVLGLLCLGGALHTQQYGGGVSREEFENLQKESLSLQKKLSYWQYTTIDMLRRYLTDIEGEARPDQCTVSFTNNELKEIIKNIEGIYNSTQGLHSQLSSLSAQLSRVEDRVENIEQKISETRHPPPGTLTNPVLSCQSIPKGFPSGHYWIQNAGIGRANLEYCDMTRRCCNSTGGWMRVANLDMTDTNQHCPSGFRRITSPKRTCGTPGSRCVSTTFPVNGSQYSRVCGKIIGYQYFTTNAFGHYHSNRGLTIDDNYVDGVSLTHGQTPRKHIWTFAAAHDEAKSDSDVCPCSRTTTPFTGTVPPFIGQDYFCDSGSTDNIYNVPTRFFDADPLWDGSGCGPTSSCCSFNNPPWFCKQLPQPTTDDIEMRTCTDNSIQDEYVALESVEIYVQ